LIVGGKFRVIGPTGIGAGPGHYAVSSVGQIVISGGDFELQGIAWEDPDAAVASGAALGTGFASFGNSTIDSVTIRGGTLVCRSDSSRDYIAAGIGAGPARSGNSLIRVLNISDAIITSIAATGIGAGTGESGNSVISELSIARATVTAVGKIAAGIGGGHAIFGSSSVGTLSIVDSIVNTTGENGGGVGAGYADASGQSRVDTLVIRRANVSARSQYSGAIGAGHAAGGVSSVGVVDITDSNVSAIVAFYGAGIGGGMGGGTGAYNGRSDVDSILITDSNVRAVGRQAAAIGAGSSYLSNSTVNQIVLTNGTFNLLANFGAGVGAGDEMAGAAPGVSLVHNISITGGYYHVEARTAFGSTDRANARRLTIAGTIDAELLTITSFCLSASTNLAFEADSLRWTVNSSPLGNVPIDPDREGDLWVQFTGPSEDSGLGLPVLHIGGLAYSDVQIIAEANNFERTIDFGAGIHSVLFSVPPDSQVRLKLYEPIDGRTQLCHDNNETFEVGGKEAFFSNVKLCDPPEKGLPLWAEITIGVGSAVVIAVVVVGIVLWRRSRASDQPVAKYTLRPEDAPTQPSMQSASFNPF
jgi:hypothetical protein